MAGLAQEAHGPRRTTCAWRTLTLGVVFLCHHGPRPAKAIGAMGGHVDDFHRLGDDSEEWKSIKVKSYRHAGTDITTQRDANGFDEIVVDQEYYIETLQDIEIAPDRLFSDGPMTKKEIDACRTSLGALQWLAIQSQPQLCARCNLLLRRWSQLDS